MEVISENDTNWLVLTNEGGTATKTKSSNLNQLLYGHKLWGLLEEGSEVWRKSGEEDEPDITLIPDDNAECYTIRMDDAPDLTLGKNRKTDLIDAIQSVYDDHDGDSVAPIVNLYDNVRENMVRPEVLSPFSDAFGGKIEERDDGWFINGHLLLTYEGDFFHPGTESRKRSGQQVIQQGSNNSAYSVSVGSVTDGMERLVTVDGENYRLTDSELEFVARVVWAIENTPDRR